MTLKKPACDKKGRPRNPADLPALQRYQAIWRLMRTTGRTEAEAIAMYDMPRGVCRQLVDGKPCGNECPGRGRTCLKCRAEAQKQCQRKYRADKRHHVEGRCKLCGKKFKGCIGREFCDEHSHRSGKKRGPKPKPKPVVAPKPKPGPKQRTAVLPKGWDKPAEYLRPWEKPLPVDVTKHADKLTVIPSRLPSSRWD